jgi:hypothetical protein
LEPFEYSRPGLLVGGGTFFNRHLRTALGLIGSCGAITLVLLGRVTSAGLLRTLALIRTSTHNLEGWSRRFLLRCNLGDTRFGNARFWTYGDCNCLAVDLDYQAIVLRAPVH